MNINDYIQVHRDRFLDELKAWLQIPSISANPDYAPRVQDAADYLAFRLKEAGLDAVQLLPTPGFPVVYAEKMIDAALPTVLVYGHYDVQPPDPLQLWTSGPFEPVVKDGKIYARGAADDKGQVYMHVKAAEYMISKNMLACNIKFLIEGEEEVGSVNLGDFVRSHRDLLACDVVLISDTSIIANDVPSITTGLRGLAYMEVEVTGPNRDLHSGVYGGAVGNPINTLCGMIASLHDAEGRITIPGFYDAVEVVSAEERAEMGRAPFDEAAYMRDLDIAAVKGESGYTTPERVSIRPTLDVNGIWGGYTGEGAKTVLPSKAYAKISMRLVPHQDSEAISALFQAHFEKIAPPEVKVKVTALHGGEYAVTSVDSIPFKAASMAMEKTFGVRPIPQRTGGSIPIVGLLERELNASAVLMGFGLDSDAIHSPNEHYGLFNFYKGIETIPAFFEALRSLS
jgi:acetylornithine deacetylase/succinyl-diaminopimelate desuccinylase-like protein